MVGSNRIADCWALPVPLGPSFVSIRALSPNIFVIFLRRQVGQSAPEPVTASASSIRVRWRQPKLTNGDIIVFRLYLNDRDVICEGLVYECLVEGLDFFTRYRFRVESCTVKGCVKSVNAFATTFEAPPIGEGGEEAGEREARIYICR